MTPLEHGSHTIGVFSGVFLGYEEIVKRFLKMMGYRDMGSMGDILAVVVSFVVVIVLLFVSRKHEPPLTRHMGQRIRRGTESLPLLQSSLLISLDFLDGIIIGIGSTLLLGGCALMFWLPGGYIIAAVIVIIVIYALTLR